MIDVEVVLRRRQLSRYQFVSPTFLQTTEAVVDGIDAAWTLFGGVAVASRSTTRALPHTRQCAGPDDQSLVRGVRAGARLLHRPACVRPPRGSLFFAPWRARRGSSGQATSALRFQSATRKCRLRCAVSKR